MDEFCECECSCEGTHCEFFRERIITARKQHKCIECDKPIMPGDRYQYLVGKWEGYIEQSHTCIGCARLRDAIGHCCAIGELDDIVRECTGSTIMYNIDLDQDGKGDESGEKS